MGQAEGEAPGGQADGHGSHQQHQTQHAGHPSPAQGAEFGPAHICGQQGKKHRDRQLGQLTNQLIELGGIGIGPATHHHTSSHGRGQPRFGQQQLTATKHQKQGAQGELEPQGPGRLGGDAAQGFGQQPAAERTDRHTATEPLQQPQGQLPPAMEVAQSQLQKQ